MGAGPALQTLPDIGKCLTANHSECLVEYSGHVVWQARSNFHNHCEYKKPLLNDEQRMINPTRDTLTELYRHISELTVRIYRTSC